MTEQDSDAAWRARLRTATGAAILFLTAVLMILAYVALSAAPAVAAWLVIEWLSLGTVPEIALAAGVFILTAAVAVWVGHAVGMLDFAAAKR